MNRLLILALMLPTIVFGQLQQISKAQLTWYGAKADGTDCTSALQLAVNLNANGNLEIPPGIYSVSGVTIRKPITITGSGTLKSLDNTPSTAIFYVEDVRDVSISGVTFDGNIQGQTVWSEHVHCIQALGAINFSVNNCMFTNIVGDGVYLSHTNGAPLPYVGVTNVIISDCVFTGENLNRQGVSIICGDGILISGNTFSGMTRITMPAAVDLEGNYTEEYIRNVKVINNNFIKCKAPFYSYNAHNSDVSRILFAGNTAVNSVFLGEGFFITNATTVNVLDNYFEGTVGYGIVIRDVTNFVAQGNVFSQQSSPAFSLLNSPRAIIAQNIFNDAYSGGVAMTNSPGTLVNGNTFYKWGASQYAVWVDTTCNGTIISGNYFDGFYVTNTAILWNWPNETSEGYNNTYKDCKADALFNMPNTFRRPLFSYPTSGTNIHYMLSGGNGSVATPWISTALGYISGTNISANIQIKNTIANDYATWLTLQSTSPLSPTPLNVLELEYNQAKFFDGTGAYIYSDGKIRPATNYLSADLSPGITTNISVASTNWVFTIKNGIITGVSESP